MMMSTQKSLRLYAISRSLFRSVNLKDAFERLGFVQADPIRSPARAQDLILRQRVDDYYAGDLERQYPSLDLEEDFLYAYGFMTRDVWQLLYPRKAREVSRLEQEVLEAVSKSARGEMHPRELETQFGRERVVNAWGGYSQATKRALESLHHRGLLRVTRREKGIRVYGIAGSLLPEQSVESAERLRKLIVAVSNIFAPVTERCLQEALAYLRRGLPDAVNVKMVIADLVKSGELLKQSVDGINYLYPPPSGNLIREESLRRVRFLAPFDPLVWDRRRFEHFWGWSYRFEAYTPQALRIRGYYAMPMLWGDSVIGWANAGFQKGVLDVELGFVGKKPTDSDFRTELEKEIGRLETFLDSKHKTSPKN